MNISILSVLCALFVASVPGSSYGASSVRALGGTGTYTSASNAASAKTNPSVNVARAASLKAAAGTVTSGVSANGANSVSSASSPSTARLSIGSYLNSGRTISGGSSIKSQNPGSSGGSTSSGGVPSADLQNQIDDLRDDVSDLQTSDSQKYTMDETDDLLDEKQDVLTAGAGIDITNNIISSTVVNGREVLLRSNGTHVQWKYDDATSTWEDLIALSELVGPAGPQGLQGPQGEPGAAANLSDYLTSTEVNNAITTAITNAAGNYATAVQGAKADTALQPGDVPNVLSGAPADGSDYVLTVNNEVKTWMKVVY